MERTCVSTKTVSDLACLPTVDTADLTSGEAQTEAPFPAAPPSQAISSFSHWRVSAHPWPREKEGRHRLPALLPIQGSPKSPGSRAATSRRAAMRSPVPTGAGRKHP